MNKMSKALRDLNRFIDADYKKLYDRFRDLELSHNRKRRALQKIREFFLDCESEVLCTGTAHASLGDIKMAIKVCDDALFCDGRVNERIKE